MEEPGTMPTVLVPAGQTGLMQVAQHLVSLIYVYLPMHAIGYQNPGPTTFRTVQSECYTVMSCLHIILILQAEEEMIFRVVGLKAKV